MRFIAPGNAAHAIVRAIVDEFEDNVLEDYEKEIGWGAMWCQPRLRRLLLGPLFTATWSRCACARSP